MNRQGLQEKLILLQRKGLLREKKKSTYRIYFADGLDKRVRIEPTLNLELEAEREELQELICNKATKFKIALTNPPFAMRYKREDPDQGQYTIFYPPVNGMVPYGIGMYKDGTQRLMCEG